MKPQDIDRLETEGLSIDLGDFTDEELKMLFRDMTPAILNRWLDHFARKEQYEICQVIRDVISEKKAA